MPIRPVEIMEKHTYDANKDGRIEKNALAWTANKLLKGGGAGADPTEIDVPSGVAATSGSYTGNDTANRAIPHGLGATPKIVFLEMRNDTTTYAFRMHAGGAKIVCYYLPQNTANYVSGDWFAVTEMDATNFYVGSNVGDKRDSGNALNYVYRWVAIG